MKWLKKPDINTLSSTEWVYLAGKWKGKYQTFIIALMFGIVIGCFIGYGFNSTEKLPLMENIIDHLLYLRRNCPCRP
jgi:hypothetical protein